MGYEINTPKVKILLVGQDWGNADDFGASILRTIRDINKKPTCFGRWVIHRHQVERLAFLKNSKK
nr:hypothetical protein [uncultured Campylobacter sp.]